MCHCLRLSVRPSVCHNPVAYCTENLNVWSRTQRYRDSSFLIPWRSFWNSTKWGLPEWGAGAKYRSGKLYSGRFSTNNSELAVPQKRRNFTQDRDKVTTELHACTPSNGAISNDLENPSVIYSMCMRRMRASNSWCSTRHYQRRTLASVSIKSDFSIFWQINMWLNIIRRPN